MSLGSIAAGQGARARVIFVLHKCIWNVPAVLLVFPANERKSSEKSDIK